MESGSDGEETLAFSGKYQLVPVSTPMVPQRKTAAPMVHGPQTAMVVGDGEIDCDDHGRILVHFHWDLDKAFSMRCRVSQNWAGNGWGGMVIPRIGMEVLVEFLEGDPDKPMVTGCVYNGKNKPPYELPANKTTLWQVTEGTGQKTINYIYDFGDNWEHRIKIGKITDPVPGNLYPRLIEVAGKCPPEDVGGFPGYYESLTPSPTQNTQNTKTSKNGSVIHSIPTNRKPTNSNLKF